MKSAGYAALADFVPVAALAAFDSCPATNPAVAKASTQKEFVDLVRKYGKLGNIGVPTPGSLPQFYAFVIGKDGELRTDVGDVSRGAAHDG